MATQNNNVINEAQINKSLVTAKGDILVASGSAAVANLAVGANNKFLMSDSGSTNGIKWDVLNFSSDLGATLETGLADGKYSGIIESGTAGATLAFGDLCYFQTSDSRWELFDADAESTASNKLGICVLAAANDGSATKMLLWGNIRANDKFPTFTIGAKVFGSTTAGEVQTAAPSGTTDIVRIVGYGNTGDELFFCPSNDYFEVT